MDENGNWREENERMRWVGHILDDYMLLYLNGPAGLNHNSDIQMLA